MEAVPKMVTGDHIFYMPHKPVVEESASMTTPTGQQHKPMYVQWSTTVAFTVGHLDQRAYVHSSCSSGYSEQVLADWQTRGR